MIVEKIEAGLGRAFTALPESVLQRLAGRPIEKDGNRLAPEAHMVLTLFRLTRETPLDQLSVAKARQALERHVIVLGMNHPIGAVRNFTLAGRPARAYTPTSRMSGGPAPTMLYFHGGFHTYGSLDSHDGALRQLAETSGVQVIALDYRLAPEHPFPAGLDDCVAALREIAANPSAVGADPERLAVGGDSAGGNLAAATVQLLADEIPLAFQLLVYPVTDFTQTSESRRSLGAGFYLTRVAIEQARGRYLPDERDYKDARATVLNGTVSPKTPPTLVVTAGFDPLRDEGQAYAEKLSEAGMATDHLQYGDMIHGFFNQVTYGRRAPGYNREIAGRVAAVLTN